MNAKHLFYTIIYTYNIEVHTMILVYYVFELIVILLKKPDT